VEPGLTFRGDRGDLMEMLGNLLDNAYKYCRSEVRVTCEAPPALASGPALLRVCVEDDGNGFPAQAAGLMLQRGVRADEAAEGQGIGLAVVREIAESYHGGLALSHSGLGGARVELSLPGA